MNPRQNRRAASSLPSTPGATVFHVIAWLPSTHRWVRGIVGFVVGCAIPAVIHEYWGARFPWINSWPAILGPAATLATLGALLPVPRPWLCIEVGGKQLTLSGRDGQRKEIPVEDVRMVAGEGGVDVGPGRVFCKYLYFATREDNFRLKLPPVRSQRCFADMLAVCPYAIGIDFGGQVRMPDLSGAAEPRELVRCALEVASTELLRQGRRALLNGVVLLGLALAGGLLLLRHSLFQSIRHSGAVAAGIVAGALLVRHGLRRLAKYREVARQVRALLGAFPGTR